MPEIIFKITCKNKQSCQKLRDTMKKEGYKNKTVRGNKDHDHTAQRFFNVWLDATHELNRISNFPEVINLSLIRA